MATGFYDKEEMLPKVYNLALLGATDKIIAAALSVSIETFNKWKQRYPELKEALKKGKIETDAKVAKSLLDCALGYDYEEDVVVHPRNRSEKSYVLRVQKHVKADPWSCSKWLALRQRELWAEVQRSESKNTNVQILKLDLTGLDTQELLLLEKLRLKELVENAERSNN